MLFVIEYFSNITLNLRSQQSISMPTSQRLLQTALFKLQKIKSKAETILESSKTQIHTHLNTLIASTLPSTIEANLATFDFIQQDHRLKTERIQQLYQMLMNTVQISMQWMDKYQQLQFDLHKLEDEKQSQQISLKKSIQDYYFTVSRLVEQKQELENEVYEVSQIKQRFKKLYEDEIRTSSELLPISSQTKCIYNTLQTEQNQNKCCEAEQDQQNDYLQDMINDLRSENNLLRSEIKQLRSNTLQIGHHTDGSILMEEMDEQQCLKCLPSEDSVIYQDKHTLASEFPQIQSRMFDTKEVECFSYSLKQKMIQKTMSEQNVKLSSQSGSVSQCKLVPHRIVKKDKLGRFRQMKRDGVEPFYKRMIRAAQKRYVKDRIKRR